MRVEIREVGPRDGLQAEEPVPVADRVRLIEALLDAGIHHIEACAFVSPTAVPPMAGAGEVVRALQPRSGVTYWALVPNLKGAQLADEAGVDHLTFTVSASPEYNRRNVRMEVDESIAELAHITSSLP